MRQQSTTVESGPMSGFVTDVDRRRRFRPGEEFPLSVAKRPVSWGFVACMAALLAATVSAEERMYGPFPPSALRTSTGTALAPTNFMSAEDCAACHGLHFREWAGSLHSAAHRDKLYLAFAELARKEGGDALYTFCASCHAPGAVATKQLPAGGGGKESFLVKEGVTCDICHTAAKVEAVQQGAGANASMILDASTVRFGPIRNPESNDAHASAFSSVQTESMLCSACHTLVHPFNGLVIENTYQEWRRGPYAEAGIQCQDCHMRSVSNALEVARTMKPLQVPGKAVDGGSDRTDVHEHMFVGGNALGASIDMGADHAAAAIVRLKNAVTMRLSARWVEPSMEISVTLSNAAAGHAIPTSITELRQVWLDVKVTDGAGREVYRSGAIDASGRVDPAAVMYRTVLADREGQPTYLFWRAEKILNEKLIPPRSAVSEIYRVPLPLDARPPLRILGVLRYRSAPQDAVDALFGKGRFEIPVIDMAESRHELPAAP